MATSDATGERSARRPRLSVVIPTYRRPGLLAAALDSVLAQRRPADEIFVVPDGPDPDAAAVVAARPGVVLVEIPHGGVARARNAGIAAAAGDWICFLDDDDLYHPDLLAEIEAYVVENPDAEAINTEYWTFSETPSDETDLVGDGLPALLAASTAAAPRSDMEYLRIEGRSYELLLGGLRGNLSSSAVRRERLLEAGAFPAGAVCAEDWTMFVNVARYTEWHLIERRLVFMRRHPGNNTSARAVLNGVHTIEAFRDAWRDASRPIPPHRPLRSYRWDYRFMVRGALDSALAARDGAAYRRILRAARELLPRRTDRIRAMIPQRLLRRG